MEHIESIQENVRILTELYYEVSEFAKTCQSMFNLSSTSLELFVAYSAIKGAIVNLTRYMASYFGPYNVRVNTVCPGGIFNHQNPVFVKNYSYKTPLKRMGRRDEIASVVLFLASDAASYITGTTIMVDGGWTAM